MQRDTLYFFFEIKSLVTLCEKKNGYFKRLGPLAASQSALKEDYETFKGSSRILETFFQTLFQPLLAF